MKKLRVGVIGIGDISNVYLNNLKKYDAVEVVACASRGLEKAQRKAAEHGIGRRITTYEYHRVVNYAMDKGLVQGYMQQKSSAKEEYTPSFDLPGV